MWVKKRFKISLLLYNADITPLTEQYKSRNEELVLSIIEYMQKSIIIKILNRQTFHT